MGDNLEFLRGSFNALLMLLQQQQKLWQAAKDQGVLTSEVAEAESVAREADLAFLLEEIPQAIEQGLEGIRRVANIVRSMGEFAHPGTDRITPVDLNRAIASTVTVCRNEWKYVADLEIDLEATLPPVPCLPSTPP